MDNNISAFSEEEESIDLLELFHFFRKKLKYIILFLILGGVLVGLFTMFFIAPRYEATTQIYIVSASNDSVVNLSDLQIGTNLTADYQSLLLCRPMMESVISNLHLQDMTVAQLKKMISIDNPSNTRIIEVTVTSTDPVQARDIANETARLAVRWLPEVMESNEPNIAEEAIIPDKKSSPSITKNAIVGAVAFAAVYIIICVIRFVMDDTIKTPEDLEHYFGIVPMTSIPEVSSITDDKSSNKKGKRGTHQA